MDEAESWPEAIASRSDWLPSSRFLTKSRIDARAAANNRNWLRSSLISVPAQSARSLGGDGAEITGRVISRYNPDSEGRLRVEFGFVPEWAFTDTSSTAEAVERLGADGLPRARYLRVATIDARRDVWLRSSVIDVPLRAPVVVIEQPQASVIGGISCAPSSPTVNESVTCTATLSGDAPDSYAWSGGVSSGSGATYTTSFGAAGEATVSLTVTNSGGSDTDSITINVEETAEQSTVQAPVIDSIDCTRSRVAVNPSGYTDCTASLSGGAPASWAWSGGDPSPPYVHRSTDRSIYGAYFSAPDGRTIERTISLTVENAGGSDTASITITVVPAEQALSISCSPTTVVVGETVTCQIDSRHGDGIRGYYWSTLAGSGSVSPVNSVTSTYSPSFSRTGVKTIELSVIRRWLNRNANVATTTVTVNLPSGLPRIDRNSFSCSPSSPTVGDDVTCTAAVSGGEPDSWAWSVRPSRVAGNASGSGERFTTSFNRPGLWDVRLIVRNAVGGDRDEFPLEVAPPAPVINSITCSPSSPTVNESVACTAELGGGMHDAWVSWDWSGGAGSGDSAAYNTSFGSAGSGTVSLTVTNSAGSDTDNLTLTVLPPPPVINGITCSPASPTVDQSVTCTANLSGGAPNSYAWSGGASNGGGVTYSTSFGAAGETAVSLTVTNSGGSDTESTTVSVAEPLQAPVIDGITCSPSSTNVGREFICAATLSGGAPDSYAWSGAANGNKAVYQAFFRSAGSKTISLTVTNSAGSDTDSTTVSVVVVQAPVIYSVDCSPESPTVGESVTCTAELRGGDPDTYYWIGGASSGSSAEYRTSFSSAGSKTVGLQVTNVTGSSLRLVGLTVLPPPPAINGITCSPSSPTVYESVTCTATLSGGAPTSYSWSGGASSGSGATYTTSFATAGVHTVSLTVTNSVGSDSSSRTLTVTAASP